ncbi:MAG: response regulator [Anaerolineae bacterium]|nr:response regulator [Anaerolineae bacterium]
MKDPYILVIDDDREIATLIQITLEARGYRVKTAYDALHGMGMICTESPALILLDQKLPKKQGLELLKDIRAMPELGGIPIIMMTGSGQPEVVSQAIRQRITDFIIKPFDLDLLVERVAKWFPPPSNNDLFMSHPAT